MVQGELATEHDYRIPAICETRRQAAQFANDGEVGNVGSIDETVERVGSLLAAAYEEGKHHAALRLGYPTPSEMPQRQDGRHHQGTRRGLRGLDSRFDEKVGVSGIGGRALFATGQENGHARDLQTLPVSGLGDDKRDELRK